MNKLTFNGILDKLIATEIPFSEFAIEDITVNDEDYNSEEAKREDKILDAWIKQNPPSNFVGGYDMWRIEYSKQPSAYRYALDKWRERNDIPNWIEIAQYGGEGKGEYWYSVKYFPDHDIYIKVVGFYTSYNGVDFYDNWKCCSEVRPQEKKITVYE